MLIYILMYQISSIQGDQVILIGHRRLRITEMVSMKEPKSLQYFLVSLLSIFAAPPFDFNVYGVDAFM